MKEAAKKTVKKTGKTSFLAIFAIFFSTSIALGQEVQVPRAPTAGPDVPIAMRVPLHDDARRNVTVVPKQPAQPAQDPRSVAPFSLSGLEKQRIESTVRRQLSALARGNAELAFANLSPATQSYFARPDAFMTSVASDVPPITRARNLTFLGLQKRDVGEAQQQVLFTDDKGKSWLARFDVQQQPAGDWRVKGCIIEDLPGQQA